MFKCIDAIINVPSGIEEAINQVGDRYQLCNGWINTNFMRKRLIRTSCSSVRNITLHTSLVICPWSISCTVSHSSSMSREKWLASRMVFPCS